VRKKAEKKSRPRPFTIPGEGLKRKKKKALSFSKRREKRFLRQAPTAVESHGRG